LDTSQSSSTSIIEANFSRLCSLSLIKLGLSDLFDFEPEEELEETGVILEPEVFRAIIRC